MSRPKQTPVIQGDIVVIPLRPGKSAIVDVADYSLVCKYGWSLKDSDPSKEYVHGRVKQLDGRSKTITLHRFILQLTDPKQQVDHINGDSLDNRRANLRVCSGRNNSFNRKKDKRTTLTSKYKGVHKRENGRWRAAIRVDWKLINLGTFLDELGAAKAYNAAAIKYYGSFARLNIL